MAENRVEDIADVISALYPVDENDPESHLERLKMVTEVPTGMVLASVIHAVIDAALDPDRHRSLMSVFVEQLDKRMIGKDRQGRAEFISLWTAQKEESESLDIDL